MIKIMRAQLNLQSCMREMILELLFDIMNKDLKFGKNKLQKQRKLDNQKVETFMIW